MCPKLSDTFLASPVDGVAQLSKRWFSVLSHDLSMEFKVGKGEDKLGEEIVTLVSIQRCSLASGVNGHLDFSPALL